MFLINLTYIKPLTIIEKYLPEHINYLDKYYDKQQFIFSGRKEPRTGGIILCKAASMDETEKIYHQDPFYQNNVATYEIIEFHPNKYSDDFSKIIN
ncbi:YciI family protein [Convivina intestini]|uniref:YciI family protein n=1 Tax=Convivina intestini TaxID=1505726 RepID=UPI00200EE697|nr:YciI family protein [Convivina intestini]CAH1852552.1 hypothetical protein R078131_00503 [Convivina intestini]